MKKILYILMVFALFSCDTKYNYIDSGLANGNFEGTMYDYLHTNSYDWDSTLLIIERAGLEDIFEGKREGYENITFFGPTNLSILRWMLRNNYEKVQDIPEELCRDMMSKHIFSGIYLRDEIPRGEPVIGEIQGNGGIVLNSAFGTDIWVYSFQEPYHNIPGVGPIVLNIVSKSTETRINVASTNIITDNGVVHSLHYDYTFGDL